MNNASGGAFWQTPLDELERQLGASANGLSSTEAAARLLRCGAISTPDPHSGRSGKALHDERGGLVKPLSPHC